MHICRACQSHFEAIMEAGLILQAPGKNKHKCPRSCNCIGKGCPYRQKQFCHSPGDWEITISGSEGIGGINTRGHLVN